MKSLIALGALFVLAACGQSQTARSTDRYAGLDTEITNWRQGIIATSELCKTKGQKCEAFEVACKAERDLSAEDQARGVTVRVVSAITWSGFDARTRQVQTGTETAQFDRTADGWTRTKRDPVNLSSCADLGA